MPGLARAALVALAFTLLAPAVVRAAPATLKGKLTGVELPRAGKGVSSVRAMDVNSTAVVAAAYANRRGAFRLKVPPGRYGLLAAVVPFSGAKAVEKVVGRVRLKSGKTRSVKLAVKKVKPKRKRKHRRRGRKPRRAQAAAVPDGFGDVSVSYPAIAVRDFVSTNPAQQDLANGMIGMLITDLGAAVAAPPCTGKVVFVERARIDAVLDELTRSKGAAFDPGTKPQAGKIVRDNAKITGTVSQVSGVFTVTATYTDIKTGKATTFAESGADFFDIERRLAEKLAKLICDPPPDEPPQPPLQAPAAYEGTFSGFLDERARGPGGIPLDVTWTGGTMRFANRTNPSIPFVDDWAYSYEAVSGSATVTVRARRGGMGGCDLDGTEPVSFAPVLGTSAGRLFTYAGDGPPYRLTIVFPPLSSVTVTKSNCDPPGSEGETAEWPLMGYLAAAPEGLVTGSGGVLAGSFSTRKPGEPAYDFAWSFSPAP